MARQTNTSGPRTRTSDYRLRLLPILLHGHPGRRSQAKSIHGHTSAPQWPPRVLWILLRHCQIMQRVRAWGPLSALPTYQTADRLHDGTPVARSNATADSCCIRYEYWYVRLFRESISRESGAIGICKATKSLTTAAAASDDARQAGNLAVATGDINSGYLP